MSFADKVIHSGSQPLHFITSKDGSGRRCYYILRCSKATLDTMLATKSVVKPEEYGQVIDSGFGHRPPENICQMLREKYGFEVPTPPESA